MLYFRALLITSLTLHLTICLAESKAHPPLNQRQACSKFSDAVVRIDAGGMSYGTGFIVSPDGYILTASHVIRSDDGEYYSTIRVGLPAGAQFARVAAPVTLDSVGRDFVLLKVDTQAKLPFLPLGSDDEVTVGADATIIGFPVSAITMQDKNVFRKFCLSASFAATDLLTVPVDGMKMNMTSRVPVHKDVKVDVVYFQGPSVKGISGSPIISRDTGHVVGIVTLRLTGIGTSLMTLKQRTAEGLGGGIAISGLEPGKAVNEIVTVLDDQLANDLGAATGIDDPKQALKDAQRKPSQKF